MSEVTTEAAAVETPTETTTTQETTPAQQAGAKDTTEQAQAKAILKEKFKLTVDGKEFEEELDWNDKEGIKRKLQMAHAAEKRMSEAKAAKAKAFDIVKAFEENPENILKRLGPKGREVAEKFLLEQIQNDMLTPEEKEYRELKKYKEMTEAEKAKAKEESEKSAKQAQEYKYAQEFQTTIISALEKSGLPKTPELVKRMAGIMQKNLSLGLDLTPEDLVIEVKKDALAFVKAIAGDSDGDQLLELFGKEIANKIRKSDLKKLKEKQDQVFQQPQSKQQTQSKRREDRPMSIDEWKESIAARIK